MIETEVTLPEMTIAEAVLVAWKELEIGEYNKYKFYAEVKRLKCASEEGIGAMMRSLRKKGRMSFEYRDKKYYKIFIETLF